MYESFSFWEFSEWKTALGRAGFQILENPNRPGSSSRVYTNRWIVENRWQKHTALYQKTEDGRLVPLPWPETNIVLVGEK